MDALPIQKNDANGPGLLRLGHASKSRPGFALSNKSLSAATWRAPPRLEQNRSTPGRARWPGRQRDERSGSEGELVFDWGRCALLALDDTVVVRADAADEDALIRAQSLIGHRQQPFGRRERLTVEWKTYRRRQAEGLSPSTLLA
jgi:hypothetical protein